MAARATSPKVAAKSLAAASAEVAYQHALAGDCVKARHRAAKALKYMRAAGVKRDSKMYPAAIVRSSVNGVKKICPRGRR